MSSMWACTGENIIILEHKVTEGNELGEDYIVK